LNAQLISVHPDHAGNNGGPGTNALLSVAVKAVPGINIMASGIFYRLDEFSDLGTMWFAEEVGINIIDNLSLNLSITESISQADDTDMFIRAWFWLTYGLDNITPRLDVNYVMAGTGWLGDSINPASIGLGHNFDKNYSFLTVSPSVKFKVTQGATFELGYVFGMDMSKDGYYAIGTKTGGVNHAAFIDAKYVF
jgi:hypothetical protein